MATAQESNANNSDASEELSEGAEGQQQEPEAQGLQEVEAVVDVAPRKPSRREEVAKEREQYKRDREEWADERRKTQEQFARMERMLQERTQFQPQQQERRQEPAARDYNQEIAALQKQQREAFKKGDDETWHDIQAKLTEAHAERFAEQRFKQFQQSQPQQRPEPYPWVRAVEAGHPDVLAHRHGTTVVRAHVARLAALGKDPDTYETLAEAFRLARADLGTGGSRREESNDGPSSDGTVAYSPPRANNDRRAMMGNGPSQGVSGRRSAAGPGQEVVKGLHPQWQSIAKKAGMTNDEYIKYHKESEAAKRQ